MSAPVRCPNCNHLAFVQPEDILTAFVTCTQCGLGYQPTGPDPEPEPQAEAIRVVMPETPHATQDRAEPESVPEPRSRRWLWVLISGLATLTLAAVGVVVFSGAQPSEPAVYNPDETFQLAFPDKAEWMDEPFTIFRENRDQVDSSIRLFRTGRAGEGWKGSGRVFAVRLVDLGRDRWVYESNQKDAATAVARVASLIVGGRVGNPEPVTCNGYPAMEVVVSISDDPQRVFILRGIAIEDTGYVMIVSGRGVRPDQPEVQAFFNSFRHTTIPPPPADYPLPPEPLFQHVAQLPPFSATALSPSGDRLYTNAAPPELFPSGRDVHGQPIWASTVLARHQYPTFRREAVFPLREGGSHTLIDGTKERVFYVKDVSNMTQWNTPQEFRILRYDMDKLKEGPLTKDAANPPTLVGTPVPTMKGMGGKFLLSPDGKYLYALVGAFTRPWFWTEQAREVGPATLQRFDTDTLALAGTIPIPATPGGLALSPDGQSLYVVAHANGRAVVWDYDPVKWVFRRELRSRYEGKFEYVSCSTRGQLFLSGISRTGALRITQPVRVLDLNTNPPTERRLSVTTPVETTVSDGRLLITYRPAVENSVAEVWDVEGELATFRPRKLAEFPGSVYLSPNPVFGPDGKWLRLGGRIDWLTGAGPLPEVDPAAKWKSNPAGRKP